MNKGNLYIAQSISEQNSENTPPSNDNIIAIKTARFINPRGLPRVDAALYVGCSARMFDGLVKDSHMPAPRLIGSKKVWDIDELDECFWNLPRSHSNDDRNEWDEDDG